MAKFYIVQNVYKPSEATINRLLAFLHRFDQLGIQATVVFLMPDAGKDKVSDQFDNIVFEYLWESLPITHRKLKYVTGLISTFKLKKRLCSGDKVLMFDVCYWDVLLGKKGVRYYYESTECPDIKNYYTLPRDQNHDRYIRFCKQLDGLFVISTHLKTYFEDRGVDSGKIHIINMIVDTSRFESVNKQESEPYIAYCGTASNNKDGVDQLINAFALFNRKHKEVKLYIIGKTPDKTQAFNNSQLVEDLGIKDSVVFTGRVSAANMPQILKNACIVALDRPDNIQAKYGFPTKLGEYLSTKNPVVVTKVGDIPKFLVDGVSAYLAEPENPNEFSSKLCEAYEKREISAMIGKKGAEIAKLCFNSITEGEKMANIIFRS